MHEAACPVIALIHAPDPDFVREASKRGVFAYVTDAEAKDWQSSIDIVLRRFTEYHDLEGAFGRRAVTERAKGILMERHSVDEPAAFELLREHARSTNRKLVDVASAVVADAADDRSFHVVSLSSGDNISVVTRGESRDRSAASFEPPLPSISVGEIGVVAGESGSSP